MKEVKWYSRVELSFSDFVSELVNTVIKLVLTVFIILRLTFDVKIFLSLLVTEIFFLYTILLS